MPPDTATFDLPPLLKLEECQQLHSFLQQSAGTPVTLNCADVTRLGGLPAQLITMAAKTWAEDNVPLAFAAPSADFRNCLDTLGLTELLMENGGIQ